MHDPETTRALGQVTAALEHFGNSVRELSVKVDAVAAESRQESREFAQRLEAHALDTRNRLHDLRNDLQGAVMTLARDVASVETQLDTHISTNKEHFLRLETEVDNSLSDRGRIWRALFGIGTAGGAGAALSRWLETQGGP